MDAIETTRQKLRQLRVRLQQGKIFAFFRSFGIVFLMLCSGIECGCCFFFAIKKEKVISLLIRLTILSFLKALI
ncbi:hypothetical protein ODR38_05045 [Pediococcus acidilactici]